MSQKQIDEATAVGYSLEKSSPYEVRLFCKGIRIRTWVGIFGEGMPKLDHALVQEVIRFDHPPVAPGEYAGV
jgi:hypothetical protein